MFLASHEVDVLYKHAEVSSSHQLMRVDQKSIEVNRIGGHSIFGFGHSIVVYNWKVAVGIFDDICSAEVEDVWSVR